MPISPSETIEAAAKSRQPGSRSVASEGVGGETARVRRARLKKYLSSLIFSSIGLSILLAAWWMGGEWVASDPSTSAFADFAPAPTFEVLARMLESGSVWDPIFASLKRIGLGLGYACLLGIPLGVLIG